MSVLFAYNAFQQIVNFQSCFGVFFFSLCNFFVLEKDSETYVIVNFTEISDKSCNCFSHKSEMKLTSSLSKGGCSILAIQRRVAGKDSL